MSNIHFSPLNDIDIQTSRDMSETRMAFPQEISPKFHPEDDEEHQPFQSLPYGNSQHPEQYEMVPVDQMNLLDGSEIVHEYTNLLCCYYYKKIRKIKKKEDVESGKPYEVTRVIEAEEWLLAPEPPSDEIYFWYVKMVFWIALIAMLLAYACMIGVSVSFLWVGEVELGSEKFWTNLGRDCCLGLVLIWAIFSTKREVQTIISEKNLSVAKIRYKGLLILPVLLGSLFAFLTYPIFEMIFKKLEYYD